MDYIRRVYVAGVGYTCYLTEKQPKVLEQNTKESKAALKETKILKSARADQGVKKEISIANYSTISNTHFSATYSLNLKIGYSDIKSIDITKYIIDQKDSIEILVVGKEILTTPGYQDLLLESATGAESNTGGVVSPIKAIIIIRGNNKDKVNSLAAYIRNLRPYSVYKGIGLRLQGEPLNLKVVVKNKQKG